jgi:hypothetical protein
MLRYAGGALADCDLMHRDACRLFLRTKGEASIIFGEMATKGNQYK